MHADETVTLKFIFEREFGIGQKDDSAKGSPTQFWELFTVTPCASEDFKR